ncbi:hypothetical protein [Dactylosporangium sp. NPDC051541]|uniref:hypothetical protein n=1 Tax=Dactylosporangium sp. NPDC051541 TaxID=3363977 RepID=UPI0037896466
MTHQASRRRWARRAVPLAVGALLAGVVPSLAIQNWAYAAAGCGSQPVANNDDGFIVLGESAPLHKAPYNTCGVFQTVAANTKIWTWCTIENDYGNTWIWGRIDGTQQQGWMYIEHAKQVEEVPTGNDGWCPGEAPADPDAIDGADRIVEQAPPADADDALPPADYDPATDVDATVPAVGGAEKGVEPDADYVAPEGEEDAPDAGTTTLAAAAAALKYGKPIKRSKVVARAKNWYSRNVQYSQSAYAWDVNHGKKFRTDCSGFVSMSWALTSSRTTRTLDGVSHRINWSSLKPGDMVLRSGHHVQLFEKWANKAHTRFWLYEEGNPSSDMNHYKLYVSTAKNNGYKPWRYNKIRD